MSVRTIVIAAALLAASAAAAQEAPAPMADPKAPVPPELMEALVPAGPPEAVSVGPITRGARLVVMPVRHGITGVLKEDAVSLRRFSEPKILPAGSKMFGVPMSGGYGAPAQVLWCAPERAVNRKGEPHWTGVCIWGSVWIETWASLFVTYIAFDQHAPGVQKRPQIDRQPVDFGAPMDLVFTFTEWDKTDADVFVSVQFEGGSASLGNHSVKREADGTAHLKLFGGELLLKPGSDRRHAVVEVIKPMSQPAVVEF
ncbi:hypothetical protein [Caulobacter sp. 17J65-9]|uniref:hypothetical protein n=1 Tax=Caulobacter sp. 17J65-9 TaxID=2709382 RepID=UPI0013CAF8CB|nr:hypothetical protein [Caulobacter sp. 17J65-9]NEX93179.1 hypothetical protein [Caulobacter sp. 17J65-9]